MRFGADDEPDGTPTTRLREPPAPDDGGGGGRSSPGPFRRAEFDKSGRKPTEVLQISSIPRYLRTSPTGSTTPRSWGRND